MKILIVSDVHGNLPALESVLNSEKDVDMTISLGDVVNYGPWSNECVQLFECLNHKVLLKGNHEDAFIKGRYPGNSIIANAFFEFCYPKFLVKDIIANYFNNFSFEGFEFVHTLNDVYIFPDTPVDLRGNTFIGHSHRLFSRELNGFRLYNAGSVGQNRSDPDTLNYITWYPENGKVNLITKEFSADRLINEMKIQNYPAVCVNYIMSKRRMR